MTRADEEEEEGICRERREQLVMRNCAKRKYGGELKSTSARVRRRYRHAESSEKATTKPHDACRNFEKNKGQGGDEN